MATTGTVNPIKIAEVAVGLIPGSDLFKGIKSIQLPQQLTSFTDKLTDGHKFLSLMAEYVDDIGQGIYRNANGADAAVSAIDNRFVERVGELGGGLVATKMGLKSVDFVKRGPQGFDGIFKDDNGVFYILEAKGNLGELGSTVSNGGQMSQQWILANIRKLRADGNRVLADQLDLASRSGKINGIVTRTVIDEVQGLVNPPEFIVKSWGSIGWRTF